MVDFYGKFLRVYLEDGIPGLDVPLEEDGVYLGYNSSIEAFFLNSLGFGVKTVIYPWQELWQKPWLESAFVTCVLVWLLMGSKAVSRMVARIKVVFGCDSHAPF